MKKNYKLVHIRIEQESKRLQSVYDNMPIAGRNTRPDVQKRVKQEMQDMSFRLVRECNVLVNYPNLSIQGTKVVLGPAKILLPSLRFVSLKELKELELRMIRGVIQNEEQKFRKPRSVPDVRSESDVDKNESRKEYACRPCVC